MAIAHRKWRDITLALAAIGMVLAVAPAAAQTRSDGYKFLQAVEKGDQETVKNLYNKNSTVVDARDISDGHTALLIATKRRDAGWIRYLLTLGANPNIADKAGVTPLMLASQLGFVDGIALLASKGARVDAPNEAGETPLILAVHRHDMAMVRILLAAGADADHSDNSGRTARDYAKLDGADSQMLAEIDKADKAKTRKAGQIYGPTL